MGSEYELDIASGFSFDFLQTARLILALNLFQFLFESKYTKSKLLIFPFSIFLFKFTLKLTNYSRHFWSPKVVN